MIVLPLSDIIDETKSQISTPAMCANGHYAYS
jgi:hypothetical protein